MKKNYFFVGVVFEGSDMPYLYICNDLTVKVGDEVLVPVFDNDQIVGKVVSAAFYTVDNAPYPIEKTKTVIRKIASENKNDTLDNNKKGSQFFDIVALVYKSIIATSILTVILGFLLAVFMALLGWDIDGEEDVWIPFVIAIPLSIVFFIYSIKHPSTSQRGKSHRRYSGGGASDGGARGPGSPEDKMYSFMDDSFDFDGDGHLDSIEHDTKYDIFFGDDE